MKKIAPCLFLMVSILVGGTLKAQPDFATIRKNVNVRASGLHHDLNKTRDTLILRSLKKINYVYAIASDLSVAKKEFIVDTTPFKIALNQFKKGKHVFVAVQSPLEIVFVIQVLKESFPQLEIKSLKTVLKETVVGTDEEEIEN